MHCTNCGAYIPPGARFCAGCGAPAADPEVTRYAGGAQQQPYAPPQQPYAPQMATPPPAYNPVRQQSTSAVEQQIFKTRPTLLFIKIGYGARRDSADYSPRKNSGRLPSLVYLSSTLDVSAVDSRLLSSQAQHGSVHADH